MKMALAPFFRKNSLAVAQILRGVSPDAFEKLIDDVAVGIVFDEATSGCAEGRWALEMAVNLCARFYPSLALIAVGSHSAEFREKMCELALAINPSIDFVSENNVRGFIVFGHREKNRSDVPTVYAGSNGWQAFVSHLSPRGSGETQNPFGAGAAACLATAQLFRRLFAESIGFGSEEEVALSLMDFSINTETACDSRTDFHLDDCLLVGVGAIGNGAIWALSKTELTGSITLLDPENIDGTNGQRYVLTDGRSPNIAKVELGKSALSSSRLKVNENQMNWAEYVNAHLPLKADLVAVALDTGQDRCAVQASLPKRTLNAWTQTGDLGVSRHHFLGDQACLACLYLPRNESKNEDQIIAEALNLTGNLMEVRNALYFNTLLDGEWIQKIASAMTIDPDQLQVFIGKPLRALYREGICGGMIFPANGGTTRTEVPMAFQSAMAGILLAAEIVKFAGGHAWTNVTTKLNLLRQLGPHLSERQLKPNDNLCICQDQHYIATYKRKYP
jgi:Prokaryotic E2 family C/ThiF family